MVATKSMPLQLFRKEAIDRLIEVTMKNGSIEARCICTDCGRRCGKRVTARREENKVSCVRHDVHLCLLRQPLLHNGTVPCIGGVLIPCRAPKLNRNNHLLQVTGSE